MVMKKKNFPSKSKNWVYNQLTYVLLSACEVIYALTKFIKQPQQTVHVPDTYRLIFMKDL